MGREEQGPRVDRTLGADRSDGANPSESWRIWRPSSLEFEAIPAAVYEGLVRNASFREEQLCSLFYLDAMGSDALGSIQGLERWIAHLLARKATVRTALARRLAEVLGSAECCL